MKRFLAMLLCIVMVFSLLPTWAFASEESEEITQGEYADFEDDDLMDEYYETLGELEDLEVPEEPDELEDPDNEEEGSEALPEIEEESGEEQENTEEPEPTEPTEEPDDDTTHSKEQEEPAEEEKAEPTEEPKTEETVSDGEEEKEVTAQATYGTCGDNLTWTLDDEGTLTISGTGAMDDYSIEYSAQYKGYVTSAPWGGGIISVIIESGVNTIGELAFYGCSKLSDVIFNEGLRDIRDSAFCWSGVKNVDIPFGVTTIGKSAFLCCHHLEKVTIPNSVTSIGESAFDECISLSTVTIPGSITNINENTFHYCTSLESVTIQNGVKAIGTDAFSDCYNLVDVSIPDSVTYIGSSAFLQCDLETVSIPESVEYLGSSSFYRNLRLQTANIPEKLTVIEPYTFYWTGLNQITIPDNITSIGNHAFENCSSLETVDIHCSLESIEPFTFRDCRALKHFSIPVTVKSIGERAFEGCDELESITIPRYTTSIGDRAFYGCCLNSISFEYHENDEIVFGNKVFQCNTGYIYDYHDTVIRVPDPSHINPTIENYNWTSDNRNVTFVKYEAAGAAIDYSGVLDEGSGWKLNWECYGDAPADLTLEISLTGSAPKDSDITVSGDPWLAEEYEIRKEDITKIIICGTANNRLTIANNVFSGYTGVKTLMLDYIDSIGQSAFEGCPNLEQVDGFDEYLREIGAQAFKDCKKLTSVAHTHSGSMLYPRSLRVVETEAFAGTALKEIYLMDLVTSSFRKLEFLEDKPIMLYTFPDCVTVYCYLPSIAYDNIKAINETREFQGLCPYALKQIAIGSSFDLYTDAFSFNNGEFSNVPCQITESDLNYLKKHATLGEQAIIDLDRKKIMHGACRGLAATTVLAKMGLLTPSDFEAGKSHLSDLSSPKECETVASKINMYLYAQKLYASMADQHTFTMMSTVEKLARIEALAEQAMSGGQPFMIGYSWPVGSMQYSAHSVVGYGVEHGHWIIKGDVFDSRILVYDNNAIGEQNYAGASNFGYHLYYNQGSDQFTFPQEGHYVKLTQATNSPAVLGPTKREGTVDFYEIIPKSVFTPFNLIIDGYEIAVAFETSVGRVFNIGVSCGDEGVFPPITAIPADGSEYIIEPSTAGCDFMIMVQDALMDVNCDNVSQIIFHPNSSFKAEAVTGNYDLTLLFNEGAFVTPWYKTNIQGTGNGADISMSQAENGVLIEGADNGVVNVTLTDINGNEEKLSFETEEETVLISTAVVDGQEKPVVLADEDGDGSFESIVSEEAAESEITAPLPAELTLDREYLLIEKNSVLEIPLHVLNVDSEWLSSVKWSSEDPEIADVDGSGIVRAGTKAGTTYIVASIQASEDSVYTARCRIDVMDEAKQSDIPITANIPVTQVSTELFRTEYARFDVVLKLEQNVIAAGLESTAAEYPEDTGVTILEARFVGNDQNPKQDIRPYFALRVADDRTLEIIPTVDLTDKAAVKGVAASYKSAVWLKLSNDQELVTPEQITVKVEKKLPKLSVKPVTVNGFVAGQTVPVEITGGRVTYVIQQDLGFATLNEDLTVTVKEGVTKSGKATVNITVQPEDWEIDPVTLKLVVNNKYQTPKVTLKPKSVTVNRAMGDTAEAAVTVTPLPGMTHEITVQNTGGLIAEYNPERKTVEISAGSAAVGTYKVPVLVDGKKVTELTVKVIDSSAASITTKAAGAIDTAVKGSPVTITVSGKNYNASSGSYQVKIQQNGNDVKPELFNWVQKGNTILITAGELLPSAGKYTAEVSCEVGTAKAVNFTVKSSSKAPAPSVTLKAAGSIDVLRPGTEIVLTPTFKNWFDYDEAKFGLRFNNPNLDYRYDYECGVFKVFAKEGADVNPALNQAWMTYEGRDVTAKPVKLSLKMGKAVIAQSTKAVTLSKNDRYDRQSVILSLSDGSLYDIRNARVTMTDASGNLSLIDLGNGEYAIGYKDSKLPGNIARLKSSTVKLVVFLQGNGGSKANATLSVKVNFA